MTNPASSGLVNGVKGFFSKQEVSLFNEEDIKSIQAYEQEVIRLQNIVNDPKNNFSGTLKDSTIAQLAYNKTLKDAAPAVQSAAKAAGVNKIALTEMTGASKAATLGMKALTIASNMFTMWAITTTISIVIKGIDNLVHASEKAIERMDEAKSKISELNTAHESHAKLVKESGDRYIELSNKMDSFTTDELEEFKELNKQFTEAFPELITGFDNQGNAIANIGSNAEEAKKKLQELLEQEEKTSNYEIFKNLNDLYAGTKVKLDEAIKSQKEYDDSISKANEKLKNTEGFTEFDDSISITLDYKNNGAQIRNNLMNLLDEFKRTLHEDYDDYSLDQELINTATAIDNGTFDEYTGEQNVWFSLVNWTPEQKSLFKQMLQDDSIEVTSAIKNELANVSGALKDEIGNLTQENEKAQQEAESAWRDYTNNLANAMQSQQTFKDIGDEGLQDIAIAMVRGLDKSLYEEGQNINYDWIRNNILNGLKNLDDDAKFEVKMAYQQLLTLDPNDITPENQLAIENIINELARLLDKDPIQIRLAFGFDENGLQTQYAQTMRKAYAKFGGDQYDDKGFVTGDTELDKFAKDNSIKTKEEVEFWNKCIEESATREEAMQKYLNQNPDKTDNLSGKTFKQFWNSLGTGDDETSKKVAEEKENLLKLAEAGQLTEEAFKDSSIADTFTKAGYSISEATKEVNGFVEEVKHLNSMKTGITAIISAYDEKKDANDNRVGADTLDSMYGTLGIETWNKQDLKVWEQYKKVASDSKSTLKELKVAQDELATSFVNSNNFLSNITDNTYDYYVSLLTEMGVTNAVSIATNSLNRNKINTATSSLVLTSATEQEIDELGIYVRSLDDSSKQLAWYTIQQQIANNNALDTTESVTNLKRLAEQCGITGKAIKWLGYLQGSQIRLDELKEKKEFNGSAWDNTLDDIEHYQKLITDTVNTKVKVNTPKITTTKGNKSSETKNKDSEKKTKQFYDWIEVKLDRINRKIERFKNTMEVLLKLQSKFSSGRSALNQLSNQYAAQDKAYNRYIKQANKYVNKNGKLKGTNIKASDVRNGKIDITKLNDKQQTAVDNYKQWYDKAIDVNDAKADTILAMRDLAEQMYNLPIEEASEAVEKFSNAISNAEKEIEFAQNAEDKKGYRQKIVQSTYDTYEEQKRAYDWLKKKLASLRPKDGKLKGTNIEVDGETKITNIKQKTDKNGETYYTYNGKKLSSKELRKIKEYNAAVDARAKAEQTKTEAELDLVSIIRETAVSLIQDVIDDIGLIEDIASATSDVWSSYRDMREAMGNIINSTDYDGEIASVQNESALAYKKWQEAKGKKDYWNSLDDDGKLKELGLSDSDIANMDNNSKAKALTDGLKELEADVLGFESEYYQKESQKHELIKQKNEQELRNLESQSELIESISSKYEALLSLRDAQGQEFRTKDEVAEQLKNSDAELVTLEREKAEIQKNLEDAKARNAEADIKTYETDLSNKEAEIFQKKAEQEELIDSLYDEEIYKVNQYKEALQKANEEQDKRLQLEKAQYNLLKAMNQKTQKVFNGQEFVYQADEDAIKSAQEELDNLEFDRLIDSLDNVSEWLEKLAKNNNIYDKDGNRIKTNEKAIGDATDQMSPVIKKTEDVLSKMGYEPVKMLNDNIELLTSQTLFGLDNIVSKMPDYSKLSELVSKPTEQKLTISIGDINLSNVNNAEDLARDIVNRLPNTVSQYIRK